MMNPKENKSQKSLMKKKVYQVKEGIFRFKDGSVCGSKLSCGWIRIFGQVYGPQERIEIEFSVQDAKDLQEWFNKLWPKESE